MPLSSQKEIPLIFENQPNMKAVSVSSLSVTEQNKALEPLPEENKDLTEDNVSSMISAELFKLAARNSSPDISHVTAIYNYTAEEEGELTFVANDKIVDIEDVDDDNGWWVGRNDRTNQIGLFPINYTEGWEKILEKHKIKSSGGKKNSTFQLSEPFAGTD